MPVPTRRPVVDERIPATVWRRSGGALTFTVREDYWHSSDFFRVLLDAYQDGRITIEEIRQEPYIHSEGSSCKLVVLKVR